MKSKTKIITIVLVALALGAVCVYFGFQKFYFREAPAETVVKLAEENKLSAENLSANSIKEIPVSPPKEVKPPAPKVFPGFKVYKNAEFGFEIQYPASWIVTEEINENVRGEMVKEFYFKKPSNDLRFAILPRDGLSYGLTTNGTSTQAYIGGSLGVQVKYLLKDDRRLWLLFPQYRRYNWLEDIGRLDIMTSVEDPVGDTQTFEMMLSSFKLSK